VIQLFHDRLGRLLDVAVVDQIPLGRVDFALDDDLEPERMPVQPAALVPGGYVRQAVGRLDVEGLGNFHRGSLSGR